MSNFNELSYQQLVHAAETLADITVDARWSSKTLASKLIEAGVTIDQIEAAEKVLGVTAPESNDAASKFSAGDKRQVVKMDRPNKSFSIMGHKFTADHPYVVMDEDEAMMICEIAEGFRIAHPNEAANFYKK